MVAFPTEKRYDLANQSTGACLSDEVNFFPMVLFRVVFCFFLAFFASPGRSVCHRGSGSQHLGGGRFSLAGRGTLEAFAQGVRNGDKDLVAEISRIPDSR